MAHKQEQKSYLADAINALSPWGSRSSTPKPVQESDDKDGARSTEKRASIDVSSPASAAAAAASVTSAALKASDHVVGYAHALSAKAYPKDCPKLDVQWFHAVDVALRKPKYTYPTPAPSEEKSPATPKKWMAFSAGDSSALEAAFQHLLEEEEVESKLSESQSYQANGCSATSKAWDDTKEGISGKSPLNSNLNVSEERKSSHAAKVPVNEDYLFDVDIIHRELGPAYWLGPVYAVRRGTWFFVDGTNLKPCDENLALQLEEGYLKTKPWKAASKATPNSSQSNKDVNPTSSVEQPLDSAAQSTQSHSSSSTPLTHRLFGSHMNSIVTYQDQNTAWLLSDDFLSRMSGSVYQRFAGGAHLSGTKVVRGYQDLSKKSAIGKNDKKSSTTLKPSDKADTKPGGNEVKVPPLTHEATPAAHNATSADSVDAAAVSEVDDEPESKRRYLERQMSNLVISGYQPDPKAQSEEARKQEEKEIRDDYRDTPGDDQDRDIEHLILVTHGIGQRLGARFETFNFIHDVNQFRKTLKQVYGASQDLQALNGEVESTTKNCKIQVLPICWRHLLQFPHQNLKIDKDDSDLTDAVTDEGPNYPSLEDITVDGVPGLRGILVDLALDILLYQTPAYNHHISRSVAKECNRLLALFKQRNPNFKGKVSLLGHSLGSAVYFDLLSMQSDDKTAFGEFPKRQVLVDKDKEFDFDVENLICVGSPLGLFQMLNGKKISARSNPSSVTLDGSKDGIEDPFDQTAFTKSASYKSQADQPVDLTTSSPKCKQLYNIFHPTDPVSYRLEPLISPSMASLQPQNLPYTKGSFLGAPIGHGITGIPAKVGQSVSDLWSSFSSGIANNFVNKSLGISPEDAVHMTAKSSVPPVQTRFPPQTHAQSEAAGAGTNIVAGGVISAEYQSPVTSPAQINEERKRKLAIEATEADKVGEHPPTLIDSELETLFAGFQNSQQSEHKGNNDSENFEHDVSQRSAKEQESKLKKEEAKVRALNSNGRVDYSIQEGVFDISFLQSIASHLTYWTDEDVCHFLVSQLLAQRRSVNKRRKLG